MEGEIEERRRGGREAISEYRREGVQEGGRTGGREYRRERGREGEREGGREGGKEKPHPPPTGHCTQRCVSLGSRRAAGTCPRTNLAQKRVIPA
eukprot:3678160-Rhodomonas_salina.2